MPLQRTPATPRLLSSVRSCHGSDDAASAFVGRPCWFARVRPALPQPFRPPMRFCARPAATRPFRGVPVIRGRRRSRSCVVWFVGGDVPLPAPNCVARPGRLAFVPAALMGFVPSQCCSCPRGFGGVVRPVVSHLPFREPSAPIIFVGGSAVPLSLDLDLATHVVSGDSRSGTRSPRLLGLGVPREQSVPSSRVSFGARLRLAAAETALGFASLRCSGRCRAARTGSTPFRAASLRKSASGSYPLVGFRLRLGWMCFADSSRDARPVGHNRPCSVLMRLTPSRSGFLSTRSRIGSLSEVRAPSVSLICFTFSRRGAQPN
jgi:hypothetical protein